MADKTPMLGDALADATLTICDKVHQLIIDEVNAATEPRAFNVKLRMIEAVIANELAILLASSESAADEDETKERVNAIMLQLLALEKRAKVRDVH